MNDQERQLAAIERHEMWLRRLATFPSDRAVLSRIKCIVRQACAAHQTVQGPQMKAALGVTKAAVRRALAGRSLPDQRAAFRPWAPILVAAAAASFALVVFLSGPGEDVVRDPDLAVFIDVLARPHDDTARALMELENDIDGLTAAGFENPLADWEDSSILEVDDVLKRLSSDTSTAKEAL